MSDIPENPTAAYMLATYQEQLDPDGVNVGVSRQALDEVLELFAQSQLDLEQANKTIDYMKIAGNNKLEKANKDIQELKDEICALKAKD